ncbi:SAICAR synthase-like protein, partial [Wallemia mellicola CBS 633.66]
LPSVPLKPFKNQVGGHHPIFRFSRRAVCKPLVRRENQFYESIERDHPLLLQYIPQYLGTNNCRTSSRLEQFLLMEDLTGRLKAPCVLDLKMGTRQYGVDATEDKKASQRKKAKKTTSHSLGLRLCGTQVYNVRKNEYTFQDKYFGRNVQANNFTESLSAFLYNGERILVHHIPDILAKLYKLARIISRLDGYRFYASSLLFLYDGDAKIQRRLSESFRGYNAKVDLDTGMLYARYPPKHPTEPDYGYLIGLLNL